MLVLYLLSGQNTEKIDKSRIMTAGSLAVQGKNQESHSIPGKNRESHLIPGKNQTSISFN